MARSTDPAVAATGSWMDPEGSRMPAGQVHAWLPDTDQTVCGFSVHRARLNRFSYVPWRAVQSAAGHFADRISSVCPKCTTALGGRA